MYQQNPEFEEPADMAIIWRYVDFTKFISYLEKKALFFVRSDQLSDKYEGKFTEADSKIWEEKLKPKKIYIMAGLRACVPCLRRSGYAQEGGMYTRQKGSP